MAKAEPDRTRPPARAAPMATAVGFLLLDMGTPPWVRAGPAGKDVSVGNPSAPPRAGQAHRSCRPVPGGSYGRAVVADAGGWRRMRSPGKRSAPGDLGGRPRVRLRLPGLRPATGPAPRRTSGRRGIRPVPLLTRRQQFLAMHQEPDVLGDVGGVV